MENLRARSFKPLTISAESLPASMGRQENLTSYAAARAKLLLGCYRTGEANDPETYVAAITAILSRYPTPVMTAVTHPATGLPSKKSWLPTIKEVTDACDEAEETSKQQVARERRIEEQIAARAADEAAPKPTLEELQAKYGKNWGLDPTGGESAHKPTWKAPTWDQIVTMYQAEPGRITHLADALARLRMEKA